MNNIKLDITKAGQFLSADALAAYEPQVKTAQEALENGTCPGNDFLGWLHLPSSITKEFLAELNATAQVLRENCEAVVVAGIGGSYLGARAVIEALSNSFQWLLNDGKNPVILFAGNNIGEDYLAELCDYLYACGFRFYFTPLPGFFSPFPHGTGSLSVDHSYLALEDGPPIFRQDSSCPALLLVFLVPFGQFQIQGCHLLWLSFPSHSSIIQTIKN